ncbi:succinate dehydrogenase assembly factor 2 [Dokdonella sp.]|uniref:FAD assembly factor SdhE n=1 Tax=Dokdonella sp. TaxID=2291710 RepID=UPI0031CAAFA8|nr:succinate dehydrogenase assembly factor 2 [Dokdonella sp.]
MNALSRLRWRCRRGTRELDFMLGWWLDARHAAASERQQAAFDALLDQSDPDLWDWLTGHAVPQDPRFAAIIDDIRAHHRL